MALSPLRLRASMSAGSADTIRFHALEFNRF